MGQPSNVKPPRRNPSLQPSSNWKGKPPNNRQALKGNPNPNSNRRKKQTRNVAWTQDQGHGLSHWPPRLQDLQFQTRFKASRCFPGRFERNDAAYNAARALMVDGAASGFGTVAVSYNASRCFAADPAVASASGLAVATPGALDFTCKGTTSVSGLPEPASRSLFFTGRGTGAASGLPVSVPRAIDIIGKGMVVPGAPQFIGESDTCMVSGLSSSVHVSGLSSSGAFNFAAPVSGLGPRALSSTVKGASGLAAVGPRASGKAFMSSKHRRAFHRSRSALSAPHKAPQAPAAPRNTTSFLIRAKKSGGITSLVSPNPTTPAIIPTPVMSPFLPFRGLVEEANQEWGVNGYGSMNGLIRLRSLEFGHGDGDGDDNDSESEVEQGAQSVQQLEQSLDQDVSRFVMTYPSKSVQNICQNLLETWMDDQDSHIAHLEEENSDLKERLHLMQQQVEDMRRRMQVLEGGIGGDEEDEASSGRSVADVSCL